jgi:hypothetical protein
MMFEMKKIVFQSLYTWRVAWNSLHVSNFSEFCSSFSTLQRLFVYNSCVRHHSALLNELALRIKKNILFFKAVFRLKINLAKSELVLVANVNNVDGLAGIMGREVSSFPLKYLGLPLEASFKAKSIWDGDIEKIEHHLAGWKKMYLSKGGGLP